MVLKDYFGKPNYRTIDGMTYVLVHKAKNKMRAVQYKRRLLYYGVSFVRTIKTAGIYYIFVDKRSSETMNV